MLLWIGEIYWCWCIRWLQILPHVFTINTSFNRILVHVPHIILLLNYLLHTYSLHASIHGHSYKALQDNTKLYININLLSILCLVGLVIDRLCINGYHQSNCFTYEPAYMLCCLKAKWYLSVIRWKTRVYKIFHMH